MKELQIQNTEMQVSCEALAIIKNAKSENTKKAYLSDVQKYLDFCGGQDYKSEALLVSYFANLLNTGFKYSSVKRAKIAIKNICEIEITKLTKEFMKGAAKTKFEGKAQSTKQETTALDITTLRTAIEIIDHDNKPTKNRDRTLLLLGFLGAFRANELVCLKWEDVKFVEKGVEITLRGTKTTSLNDGKELKVIPKSSNKDGLYCAVKSLKALQKQNDTNEYVFVSASNNANNKNLSKVAFWNLVKKYCGDDFSCHSLRAGLVTTAYKNGANIKDIMTRTGHKDVNTALSYVKNTDYWNAEINVSI